MKFSFHAVDARGDTRLVTARKGQTCTEALYLAGLLPSRPLCAGMGRCGQCAAHFAPAPPPLGSDHKRIAADKLALGVRLACLHPAPENGTITLDSVFPIPIPEEQDKAAAPALKTVEKMLAVDLGTTTVEWAVEHHGEIVAQGRELNPQFGAGSEVMSRLAFALREGPDVLQSVVLRSVQNILSTHGPVHALCVTGNPAMIHLLMGLDVSRLASAPYKLVHTGDTDETTLPALPPCYIPPLLSPFVGADLSAGLTSLLYTGGSAQQDGLPPKFPLLLADMGTNGEFILALSENDFLACSVPLGPALEGVGFPHGAMAEPGTITGFDLTPAGLVPRLYTSHVSFPATPGSTLPATQCNKASARATGITGTGYLSLLSGLLTARCLDSHGRFTPETGPLAARLLSGLDKNKGEAYLALPDGMALYAADVEEMLKVKAAFNLAVSSLLDAAELRPADLSSVFLAGNMGMHVRPEDMIRLGFLPQVLSKRIIPVGNTSLDGARLLCRDHGAREWVRHMARHCRTLELAGDAEFGDLYLQRMRFTYV